MTSRLSPAADPFDAARHDPRDPDLLLGARSWSRRWLFPVARPLVMLFFCLVKVLRAVSPNHPNLNGLLHRTIHWGLRTFATPEANTVILRHFHVGSELTAFVRVNSG
ncbi:MAG: DUF6999 family protein, partial [Brevundimonas sp.]|uniref:DUF6999 family protein n=1 Tax=Brevundimonas sp. TaxID=1871086 RepID=UPI0040347574